MSDKNLVSSIDVIEIKLQQEKEELLVSKEDLSKNVDFKKILMPMGVTDSMEFLLEKIKNSKSNGDFFESHELLNENYKLEC